MNKETVIGNTDKCSLRINENTEVFIHYQDFKGILIYESFFFDPKCKLKILNICRVFKYQIFEVSGIRIQIIDCSHHEKLIIKQNNSEKNIENHKTIHESSEYSIKAVFINNFWYFEGKFFRYLHSSETLKTGKISSKFLVTRSGLNKDYEIWIKNQRLEINFFQ